MDICNTHIRWGTKPLNTVFRKNSVLSGWEFLVFFPLLCVKIMTWKRMIWRKVPWNSVGLFRWAMRVTFLTAAPCIRIQIWCPCVFGWGGVALYFTCEMERPFGKQALSGLPFTHAHALCFSTLSSVWQRYSYCSSSVQSPMCFQVAGGNSVLICWPLFVVFLVFNLPSYIYIVSRRKRDGRLLESLRRQGYNSLQHPKVWFFSCSRPVCAACEAACHTLCKYTIGTLSQRCFVSTLPINNNKNNNSCSRYRLWSASRPH